MRKPDPDLLCQLHLNAVLPRVVDLCRHDPDTRERLAKTRPFSIRLQIPNTAAQAIRVEREAPALLGGEAASDITLTLASAGQLNALFTGRGIALPIPTKGALRVRALSTFHAISKRLESIMKPRSGRELSPLEKGLFVRLSLAAVVSAAAELARREPWSVAHARTMPDGLAQLSVKGTDIAAWFRKSGFAIETGVGFAPREPDATLEMASMDVATELLSDRLDSMAAIGRGDVAIGGFIPLLDGVGALMERVSLYLLNP